MNNEFEHELKNFFRLVNLALHRLLVGPDFTRESQLVKDMTAQVNATTQRILAATQQIPSPAQPK